MDVLAQTDVYDTIEHPRVWLVEKWTYLAKLDKWAWMPTHYESPDRDEAKAMQVHFPDDPTRLRTYVRLFT